MTWSALLTEHAGPYHLSPLDQNPREIMSSKEDRRENQDQILSWIYVLDVRLRRVPLRRAWRQAFSQDFENG